MSRKSKGTNAERDLVHRFWEKDWACFRAAGSGSSKYPTPDLIAGNSLRKLAIEVKITSDEKKYFDYNEIIDLKKFSDTFGAEAWVAIKFPKTPWVFLTIEDLESSGKHFVVSKQVAERRGLSFEEIISQN